MCLMHLSFRKGFECPSSHCQRSFIMGSDTKTNGDPHFLVTGSASVGTNQNAALQYPNPWH